MDASKGTTLAYTLHNYKLQLNRLQLSIQIGMRWEDDTFDIYLSSNKEKKVSSDFWDSLYNILIDVFQDEYISPYHLL